MISDDDRAMWFALARQLNGVVRHRLEIALGSREIGSAPDDPDVATLDRLLSAVAELGPVSASVGESGAAQPAERTLDAP